MARKMKDSGIEWIGEIPEEWRVAQLKRFVSIISGEYLEKNKFIDNGNIDVIGANGKIGTYNKSNLNKKSIVTGRVGTIGTLYIRENVWITDNVLSIDVIKGNIDFFYYYMNILNFEEMSSSTAQPLITASKLSDVNVVIPKIFEQEKISKYLDEKTQKIEDIKNTIDKEIESLENYKKSLITEAVTKGLDKNMPMKDSGIEWIGQIPKHWNLKTIKSLTIKSERGTSPRYVDDSTQAKVVNQATFSQGFFDKSNIKFSKIPASQSKGLLKKEDVLIASTGGGVLGKTHYFIENDEYVADGHVTILRTDPFVQISKILYYIFSVNYEIINGLLAKGSTNQTELQSEWLRNFKVPYAPIDEQKAIVFYLDNKCKIIDETISLKQKQLKTLEEYKKSLIYEYVTGKKEAHLGKF